MLATTSRQSAMNVSALISSDYGGARLEPRILNDGRYVLPESVLTDPSVAAALSELSTWTTIATPASGDYMSIPSNSWILKPGYFLNQGILMFRTGRRSAMTLPHPDVFRFELRPNDFGWWADSADKKRRSEIITANNTTTGAHDGETIWTAFTFVLGDHPGLLNSQGGAAFPFGYITQWHGVDQAVGRGPVLAVNVSNNAVKIQTRSDTGGPSNVVGHYSGPVPGKGVKTSVVMQATFGAAGHLNAWIGGTQIVNADTPIGYYNDTHTTILGYPQWGLYAINQPTTDIVYIANPEWGTTDLSARITTPLPVPDLVW